MKTLDAVIIILFTTIVLMFGSITTLSTFKESSKSDDLKEISADPESFLNKELVIIGNVYEPPALIDYRENGIRYAISQEDEEGFHSMNFKTYRGEWMYSGRYKIKGIIKHVNVCICEYRCVDYGGSCVYMHTYLYAPHFTIRNFKTNLTSHQIKDFWYINYYYFSKTIDYLCPIGKRHYFSCSYEMKEDLDAFNFVWQEYGGIFYKEYRCRPNSLERVYYIEAIEPMVKL